MIILLYDIVLSIDIYILSYYMKTCADIESQDQSFSNKVVWPKT